MPCEHYKDTLIEVAANGLDPGNALAPNAKMAALRAHFESCASCRAAFAQEQALFSSIDSGLQVTANADVPASLLPRVRAQLNHLSASRRSWVPAWAVLAATAALILTVVVARGRRQDASGQAPQSSALAHADLPAEIPAVATGAPPQTNSGQRMNKHRLPGKIQASASIEHLPVLLPAGQKAAFDVWLDGLRRGKMQANDLFSQNSDLPQQDLQISPLDVSPIEVKPLADVSGESPSHGGEARR
jgi:hypothetical protein